MNNTSEYIEMCRRAAEIQDIWEPNSGDFTYLADIQSVNIFAYGQKRECSEIWLPRQDQLQEMVYNEDRPRAWDLFCDFDEFIITHSRENGDYTLSAEQLWLAFVMHENFNKKWNGERWIKL